MKDEELIEYERRAYESRKRQRRNRIYPVFYCLGLIAWIAFLIWATILPVESEPYEQPEPLQIASLQDLKLEAMVAAADVHKEAQEPVTYEDWFRANASKMENCLVTHYCTELYPHICGTGDGLTSTSVPVTAYWTCAVDPSVIPYGSEVMVDYGDRVEFWKAQDCGVWIRGNHIDLAVNTHQEADDLGILYADVYWLEV